MRYLCDSFKTREEEVGQLLGVCEGPNLLPIMSEVGSPQLHLESGPSPALLSAMVVRPLRTPGEDTEWPLEAQARVRSHMPAGAGGPGPRA